jgi:hypothetical protein
VFTLRPYLDIAVVCLLQAGSRLCDGRSGVMHASVGEIRPARIRCNYKGGFGNVLFILVGWYEC